MKPDDFIQFLPGVRVDLVYGNLTYAVDCRMLFTGDRIRELPRTHEEIVYRYRKARNNESLKRSLESSGEIRQFYDVYQNNGKVSVTMRDDIFSKPGAVDDLTIDVRITHAKTELLHPLPLNRFRALGNLLPLLSGTTPNQELEKRLRERISEEEAQWALDFLATIMEYRLLRLTTAPENSFLLKSGGPRLTFMGHTSLLLQSQKNALLTDPILRFDFRLPLKAFDVVRLKLGAICITHSHWDHCDLQTLLWFDKDTPVLIPKIEHPSIFNPPMSGPLRRLGFTDVREVELWKPEEIDDIEIIPVPFHGEQDEPGAQIDHYTYVLKTDGLRLYGGVDSYCDTFGEMNSVLERVRKEHSPNIAFLPVSRNVYRYEFGGVNGFCRYFDNHLLRESFQYTASGQDAAEWTAILGVKWVAPYATFTFSRWSTPKQFAEFEKALQPAGLARRFYPMRPLDSIGIDDLRQRKKPPLKNKMMARWFRVGAWVANRDRRLRKTNRFYRLLRKEVTQRLAH